MEEEVKNMEEVERKILEILSSRRGKTRKWLRWELIKRGVEPGYAQKLAQREKSESLLEMDPETINRVMGSLPEIKEKYLKELGLPVTKRTICWRPETLLENKKN